MKGAVLSISVEIPRPRLHGKKCKNVIEAYLSHGILFHQCVYLLLLLSQPTGNFSVPGPAMRVQKRVRRFAFTMLQKLTLRYTYAS